VHSLSLCGFVGWAIWLGRNNFVFALKDVSPRLTVEWATSSYEEFLNVIGPPHSSRSDPQPSLSVEWSPPPVGVMKINCDAAWKNSKAAFGCIIRDHEGSVLECFGARFSALSVQMAEAIAIREACIFCLKAGISNVIIENDNASVVSWCVRSRTSPNWDCKSVVAGILALADSCNASFSSVRHEANRAADSLARWVLKSGPISSLSSVPFLLRLSFDVG